MCADISIPRREPARNNLKQLERWVPGVLTIRTYRVQWLRNDLLAGVSVAAVAVPIGIAYAPLAGLPPVVGLYASILPLIAYALFGSSRQLIVGPDAATTALVGSTLAALATGGSAGQLIGLSTTLAVLTGLICLLCGVARLGFLASFLAKPILVGYMNGVALSIVVGQLGKTFGYTVQSDGFFRTAYAFLSKLDQTNIATLVVGISTIVLLQGLRRFYPVLPGPLIAVILGIGASFLLGLSRYGMALVGPVPAGLPPLDLPDVNAANLESLIFAAAGIALMSYSSNIATARGFATRNHYDIDANQEFLAMGFANISAGISHGFVVCGADSRTAISDSVGGKTQFTGIFAALTIVAVLLFATGPIAYLPIPVLGAVLVSAAIGLFSFDSLKMLRRVSPMEFRLSLITTLGVITVGLLPGILVAVGLAILRLLAGTSRPHDAILGRLTGYESFVDIAESPDAETLPGLIVYRFDSALLFFNADHFRNRVRKIILDSTEKPKWFMLDAEPMNYLDVTGAEILDEIRAELTDQGIAFTVARVKGESKLMMDNTGLIERIGPDRFFPSVREGARVFVEQNT